MNYYRWTPYMSILETDDVPRCSLSRIELHGLTPWNLQEGLLVGNWDVRNTAYCSMEADPEDLACTTFNAHVHVYSGRLRMLMQQLGVDGIQYLPLRIRSLITDEEVTGYCVANYVRVVDALDVEHSIISRYGTDRPGRIGEIRDVRKVVLNSKRIGDARVFRVKGWELMVVVRDDVKRAVEEASMTGSTFKLLQDV